MKKLSVVFCLLCLTVAVQAQTITRSYNRQPLSAVLIDLNNASSRYHIHFVYDELEDFTVTCSFRKKSLPDAVRAVVGFYPAAISYDGDNIFVECVQKEKTKLSGRLVDTRDRPIGYANVTLLSPEDSSVVAGGVTTPDGDFVVPCRLREVIARFSIVGYATRHQRLAVGPVGNVVLQEVQYPIAPVEVKAAKSFTHTFADLRRDMRQSEVSEDSIAPMTERLMLAERRLRFTDRPKAAIYECLLAEMGVDSLNYRRLALSDMDALACASAADYRDVVRPTRYGRYFHDDMLSVIGMELGAYDELHQYYSTHGNRAAALLIELERWRQGANPTSPVAAYQYLDSLMSANGDLDISTEISIARYELMQHDHETTTRQKAEYLQQTMRRYPHYKRSQWLVNEYARLTDSQLDVSLSGNFLTTADSLRLSFRHRGMRNVRTRVYSLNATAWELDEHDIWSRVSAMQWKKLKSAFSTRHLKTHRRELTFTEPQPWQTYHDTIVLPPLATGAYIVEVQSRPHDVSRYLVHVSDVRPVVLPLPGDSVAAVTVVHALSGRPLPFAKVQFDDDSVKVSDAEGELLLSDDGLLPDALYAFTDTDRGSTVMKLGDEYDYDADEKPHNHLSLFTDRAIYRPGQTVHASAVLFRRLGDDTRVMANQEVTFKLFNPTGETVDTATVRTDDFGMAVADLRLPRRLLDGRFRLRVLYKSKDQKPRTAHQVLRVEEYKRPTFIVELSEAHESLTFGDTLRLRGHVSSMTGEPARNACVVSRVRGMKAVKGRTFYDQRDTLSVDAAGDFFVTVPLQPKEDGNKDIIACSYIVETTVTDAGGESHDAQKTLLMLNNPVTLTCGLADRTRLHRDSIRAVGFVIHAYNNLLKELEDADITCWLDGTATTARRVVKSGKPVMFDELATMPNGSYTLHAVCGGDTLVRQLTLFDWTVSRPPLDTDDWFVVSSNRFDPSGSQPVILQVGSSRPDTHILYAICCGDSLLERGTMELSDSICCREFRYRPEYGGGITFVCAWYQDGQFHSHEQQIELPLPDKSLVARWDTFRDRLTPGQQEEWRLSLTTPDGHPATAQLLATLYDRSLDYFVRHQWNVAHLGLSHDTPYVKFQTTNMSSRLNGSFSKMSKRPRVDDLRLSELDLGQVGMPIWVEGRVYDEQGEPLIGASVYDTNHRGTVTDIDGHFQLFTISGSLVTISYIGYKSSRQRVYQRSMEVHMQPDDAALDELVVVGYGVQQHSSKIRKNMTGSVRIRGTQQVVDDAMAGGAVLELPVGMESLTDDEQQAYMAMSARENLQETAFFLPRLATDADGHVAIRFTLPESVTTWKFLGYAHTRDMRQTVVCREAVARKELMVRPNMPRFVREGDRAILSARISNLSKETLSGNAVLILTDPATDKVVLTSKQPFRVRAEETGSVSFRLPTLRRALLTCKVVATANGMTDGEQHSLTVLPDEELITHTVAFTQYGADTTRIALASLFPKKAIPQALTVEYTNNPAWLMVQALHEYAHPHDDCAVCQSVAYFSQRAVSHLVGSSPEMKTMVEKWSENADSTLLVSPLDRNHELKSLFPDETPFGVTAAAETQQRRQLSAFLDEQQLWEKSQKAVAQLTDLQNTDGSWSWFKGMPGSGMMTAAVVEQLVRTNLLTGRKRETRLMLDRAFGYMARNGVSLNYLYLSALDGRQLPDSVRREARRLIRYIKGNKDIGDIYSAAQSVIVLHAYGRQREAAERLDSILAWTVCDRERGRYFDTPLASYSWLDYRIPTQTLVIEALRRVRPDAHQTLEEMRRWLLQEKRTQYWLTAINSANAIYAFLDGNEQVLADTTQAQLTVCGRRVGCNSVIPGTGYVKERIDLTTDNSLLTASGDCSFEAWKNDEKTGWGAVYAQYVEPARDVTRTSGDLRVTRELLTPHPTPLKVGDKVRVRITIESKRDLDFVQIVDRRAACLEPVNPLSGFRDGCYCDHHDSSSRYFIGMLPKGRRVVEQEFYVDRRGTYESGTVSVQCAYAPEYAATDGSMVVVVE